MMRPFMEPSSSSTAFIVHLHTWPYVRPQRRSFLTEYQLYPPLASSVELAVE